MVGSVHLIVVFVWRAQNNKSEPLGLELPADKSPWEMLWFQSTEEEQQLLLTAEPSLRPNKHFLRRPFYWDSADECENEVHTQISVSRGSQALTLFLNPGLANGWSH